MALWNFQHFYPVSKISQNCLISCLETWQADREWWVNDLINLQQLTRVSVVAHGPLVIIIIIIIIVIFIITTTVIILRLASNEEGDRWELYLLELCLFHITYLHRLDSSPQLIGLVCFQ